MEVVVDQGKISRVQRNLDITNLQYNEVLGITNLFFFAPNVKFMGKTLGLTKPRYSKHILQLLSP